MLSERENKLSFGRGIIINSDGGICIKYREDDDDAPGSYIEIYSGFFTVGNYFIDANDDELERRYTEYFGDGTTY